MKKLINIDAGIIILVIMKRKDIVLLIIFMAFFLSLVTADMPMPSNVEIIGCMNGSKMVVVSASDGYHMDYYPWVGNLKEYSVNPCGLTSPEQPHIMDEYSGKMLKLNSMLNIRDNIIVCTDSVSVLGPCMPITFYGSVLDGIFFCSDYSYGKIPRYSEQIRSDSIILPVLNHYGDGIFLSPYNNKTVSISAISLDFTRESLTSVISDTSSIKITGNVTEPLSIFISRPYAQYISGMNQSLETNQSSKSDIKQFFDEFISYLTLIFGRLTKSFS